MNMTLEPGSDVSVQKLSERYGVSRTPVREAVVRLQQSGLLVIYPHHKTVVSKIDMKRVEEEWFIQTALECAVVDNFILKCSELALDTLYELVKKQRKYISKELYREYYPKDMRFHQLIFETAGEQLAWHTIKDVVSHYSRVLLLSGKMNGADEQVIQYYEDLVFAARERNHKEMKRIIKLYSDYMLIQVNKISKDYPQFFVAKEIDLIFNIDEI